MCELDELVHRFYQWILCFNESRYVHDAILKHDVLLCDITPPQMPCRDSIRMQERSFDTSSPTSSWPIRDFELASGETYCLSARHTAATISCWPILMLIDSMQELDTLQRDQMKLNWLVRLTARFKGVTACFMLVGFKCKNDICTAKEFPTLAKFNLLQK